MSQETKTAYICPNCGHQAESNFCSNCGQSTHVHEENFIALVGHFFSHYFNYDSKFLITLKTLFFKPGVLSLAYQKKQRVRYVEPIPLYMFISLAYFLGCELIDRIYTAVGLLQPETNEAVHIATANHSKPYLMVRLSTMFNDITAMQHMLDTLGPKVFFLMIPVLALLLKWQNTGKKNLYYADHAVFALHIQSFFFALMLLPEPLVFSNAYDILFFLGPIVTGIYFFFALRKAYGTGIGRAIWQTLFTGILYLLIFIVFLVSVLYVAYYY